MNAYEQKQQDRAARLMAASEKASADSLAVFQKSRAATAGIVFGQPILVGHHSEGRHRAAQAKSWEQMGKSVALDEKAKLYAEKAASVGTGGISSDDENAIQKLTEKLAALVRNQESMKTQNKVLKGSFKTWQLSNNNANINATKNRIETLSKLATREDVAETHKGYEYREDTEDNRICFVFDGKPTEEIRAILKARAFKWSPTRGAWVRQITANALYAAKEIKAKLNEVTA